MAAGMANAVTVDVEEWFDTVLFDGPPPGAVSRLPDNVSEILRLLDRHSAKATFFVLGSVARRWPETIRAIAGAGHEIASHGDDHSSLTRMDPAEFRRNLAASRAALSPLSGADICGYRSPTWSLKGRENEFLPLIREAGFAYDSSLYGLGPGAPRRPHTVEKGLTEFPPSVFRCCGLGLPFLGGTFLRWAGERFLTRKVAGLNAAGLPAVLYFHSWEFDPAPPPGLPFYKRAVQYYNVNSVPAKVGSLLKDFRWAPMKDILEA